ncbi:MAG: glutathione S-transferase family protein [Burkholderiales bacterium]|nr:glutathione S-transferase family protein [Burkholderiales bacterium]
MLTLYNNAYSTCSQKVRLVLAEKGIAWEDRQIIFKNNEHIAPEYLRLNPNGVVPTLVHDGHVILDSSVIMEYLDEVFPEPPLVPRDAPGRAQMRKWLRYFEEVATPSVRPPSFNQAFLPRFEQLSDADFDAAAQARPLRKHFYKRMGKGGFSDADLTVAYDGFRQTAERMDAALEGQAWLLAGDRPSVADCCVAPLYDRMDDLGLADLWRGAPHVAAWLARFRARPSWSATFYPGARLSDTLDALGARRRAPADLVAC